jgi:hypothetical protein
MNGQRFADPGGALPLESPSGVTLGPTRTAYQPSRVSAGAKDPFPFPSALKRVCPPGAVMAGTEWVVRPHGLLFLKKEWGTV